VSLRDRVPSVGLMRRMWIELVIEVVLRGISRDGLGQVLMLTG